MVASNTICAGEMPGGGKVADGLTVPFSNIQRHRLKHQGIFNEQTVFAKTMETCNI
jgi:hypothetical protein